VRGEQDRGHVDALGACPGYELDAGHPGHLLVGDQRVDPGAAQDRQRLLRRVRGHHVVLTIECPGQDLEDIGLVVDEEERVTRLGQSAFECIRALFAAERIRGVAKVRRRGTRARNLRGARTCREKGNRARPRR
jgi:hypothetical protein